LLINADDREFQIFLDGQRHPRYLLMGGSVMAFPEVLLAWIAQPQQLDLDLSSQYHCQQAVVATTFAVSLLAQCPSSSELPCASFPPFQCLALDSPG
jgi:hypothetical protein